MTQPFQTPESIFDVLLYARRRGGFFLTDASLDQLQAFLHGYEMGMGRANYVLRGRGEFHSFQVWLGNKLGFPFPGPMGWHSMMQKAYPDTNQAFGEFFVLLDEFCKDNGIRNDLESCKRTLSATE